MHRRRFLNAPLLAVATLLLSACYAIGPTPSSPTDLDGNGPFTVVSFTISGGAGDNFSSGTVYYPTDAGKPVGFVVVTPGFTNTESAVSWTGDRIASHGFAVMTINTFNGRDFPDLRAEQAFAARQWMSNQAFVEGSPLAGLIDPYRFAYAGYSMGGGGSLQAARLDPGASAIIPLAGWNTNNDFSDVSIPSLVVACDNDPIAPIQTHSAPFYESLAGPKAYFEVAGSHDCPMTDRDATVVIGRQMISFLKHAVDQDGRYTGYLCNGAVPIGDAVVYESTIC